MLFLCSHTHPLSSIPNPWQTPDLFFISILLLFHGCDISGIIQYVSFEDWLFLHSVNFFKFHPSCALSILHLFWLLRNSSWYGYTTVWQFAYWKIVWVVFNLGLLQIRLLWTFVCECLHEKEVKFFWSMFKNSFGLKHRKTHHVVWEVWWLNNHGWGCFSANKIFSEHHGSEEISTIVSRMLKISLIPLAFILILFYPSYSRVNPPTNTYTH